MRKNARDYVAGHAGLIGSAVSRRLEREGYSDIIKLPRGQLDLRDAARVAIFFEEVRPQYVVLAAGRVGGII